MDVIYVPVETNDVLATSLGAMHAGKICGRRNAQLNRHEDAPDLNATLPLAAEFEFRRGI